MFEPIEIKSVIDKEYQERIYNLVTDINFSWHFMEDATTERKSGTFSDTPAFANLIYHPTNSENPYLDFFTPLLDNISQKSGLKVVNLLRMRLGFLLNTKYSFPSTPYTPNTAHRDFDQDHYTAVYYVNDSDGETVIYHETNPAEKYHPMHKSMPEQGKVLIFNGWHYHASTCPKMFTKRIALTINFTAEKNG